MATLSKQSKSGGAVLTFVAAAGGGDKFAFSSDAELHVNNGGGSPINVTIDCPGTCNFGAANNAAHDAIHSVTNGTVKIIPINDSRFRDANGDVNISYSSVTSVTVAVAKG